MKKFNTIGVLTSGGDAPGMNCAVRAITRRALANGLKVKGIIGGYSGLIKGEIIDLDARAVSNIENLVATVGEKDGAAEIFDIGPMRLGSVIH